MRQKLHRNLTPCRWSKLELYTCSWGGGDASFLLVFFLLFFECLCNRAESNWHSCMTQRWDFTGETAIGKHRLSILSRLSVFNAANCSLYFPLIKHLDKKTGFATVSHKIICQAIQPRRLGQEAKEPAWLWPSTLARQDSVQKTPPHTILTRRAFEFTKSLSGYWQYNKFIIKCCLHEVSTSLWCWSAISELMDTIWIADWCWYKIFLY